MIAIPDSNTLMPQMRGPYRLFPSTTTDLMRLDLLFEAGSAYQPQPLCAAAANKLCTLATGSMDSATLSEFMDYRGIIVETNNEVLQSTLTVYMLRRYASEVVPVVTDMLHSPRFDDRDFVPWKARRRQEILANEQRSSVQARRLFYETLFGAEHPLGRHAEADDVERLAIDAVRAHAASRGSRPTGIVLAGNVDDSVLNLLATNGLTPAERPDAIVTLAPDALHSPLHALHFPLSTSVQTTIRIGRVIPLVWDSLDYARLMIAVTALGGYFGSRLMSNLREERGYTYGIYARTQIYRGTIVFYITADVAGGTAAEAVREVMAELRRLCDEPMDADELQLVCTVMVGDFLRSVDGVFERAARHTDMLGTDLDERFTDNLRTAIATATPSDIQRVSNLCLSPDSMLVCTAGA